VGEYAEAASCAATLEAAGLANARSRHKGVHDRAPK
jgi:hypothetical protein